MDGGRVTAPSTHISRLPRAEDAEKNMSDEAGIERDPSNAEIARLLDQAVIRFQNWRVEADINPNPRMVHSLANIISIIDALTNISNERMQYSYKALVSEMAHLVDQVAQLNNAVIESISDNIVSVDDLHRITDSLVSLVNSAVGLIRLLQNSFANPEARSLKLLERPLLGNDTEVVGR